MGPVRWLVLVLVWAGWCWFFVRGKHCWLTGFGWLKPTSEHMYFPLIFIFIISLVKISPEMEHFFCFTNICYQVQETNDGLAAELEEAYMLSRIVSL